MDNLPDQARFVASFLTRARCRSIAEEVPLSEVAAGACLFADISGFTPLTESLGKSLGPQQGAEVLTGIINEVFEALIPKVYACGGDVLSFAGDAFTSFICDQPKAPASACLPALICAVQMQQEMQRFVAIPTLDGKTHALRMKVGLACGPVRRLLVGACEQGYFDLTVGDPLLRMAAAEHHAGKGEIVAAPEVVSWINERHGGQVAWGEDREGFRPLAAQTNLEALLQAFQPAKTLAEIPDVPLEGLRPYFPPPLFEWLASTGEDFQAELRPVVSAFAHLEGIDFEHDPQARLKLDQYLCKLQSLAANAGGMLARLDYGDKGAVIHVLFGAPLAHENNELRAVGWALEAQAAVREMPFITGQQIGMTYGQVYAGALGASMRRGYTLMGDEVNASARLMMACQPGQIFVSRKILQSAQKRFMFHQFPGFMVKGKFEPVPVGMPVAPLPAMPQMAPAGPLVGREAEAAELEALLNNLANGAGRVLRIEGATGLGKSRLAAELVQRAMLRGVRTLVGAALSTGQATPYLAWREIVRTLFGLQVAWPVMQQAMQMQTMLQWINPEWLPRLPLLGDLLGLEIPDTPVTAGLDPHLRQQSLFALLSDLLSRMAQQQSLLVLIEDVHWADEASLALINALALSLLPARVILAVTHRPPDDPDRPLLPALGDLLAYTGLHLSELSEEAMRSLVTAHLGGELPLALLEAVLGRAQGNPFFVEELAETIRETSRLQMVDGRWVLVNDSGGALCLPDSVQEVVLARLDRLDEGSKLLLKVSSVAGPSFDVELVTSIHPKQPQALALAGQIEALEKRDFLQQEQSEPERICRFKHTVTQEVAYGTLLYAQRRALHRAAARWLEGARQAVLSSVYQLLVHHYQCAGDHEKELYYLILAARQAAKGYANEQVVQFMNRALEIVSPEDLQTRFEALALRENAYHRLAQRAPQQADLEALQSLAETLDAQTGQGQHRYQVYTARVDFAKYTADYPGTLAAAQATLSLASDDTQRAEALSHLGQACRLQGEIQAAQQYSEQALALAVSTGSQIHQTNCLLDLGELARFQNDLPAALARYQAALQLCLERGDQFREGICLQNLGLVESKRGRQAEAQAYNEQALQAAHLVGDRLGEAMIYQNMGLNAYFQGDLGQADELYLQALYLFRAMGAREDESLALNNLGWDAMILGNYAAGRQFYNEALALARQMGSRYSEASVLSNLGLLLHQMDDQPTALECCRQAQALAGPAGYTELCAEALTHQGHALAALGQVDEAARVYQQAHTLYIQTDQPDRASEALAGLPRLRLAQGQVVQAREIVEQILPGLHPGLIDNAEEGFRVYLTCIQVLQAVSDPRAAEWLHTARGLLEERAARISNLVLRESYLNHVPAHRALRSDSL